MKILLANDTYYPHVNGSSYFTQRLAHYLKLRGHDVAVIAPSPRFFSIIHLIDGVQVYGVWSLKIMIYPEFRFVLPWLIRPSITKFISDFKPDIIHLQGHFFLCRSVLAVAATRNIPVVATNHFMPENLIHYVPLSNFIGEFVKKMAWRDFAKIFNKTRYITTPTKTAAGLIQGLIKSTVEPISCGIDLQHFSPNHNGDYLKKRYNLANIPTLLFVGRLDKEKNIDLVLRAMAKALRQCDFQLAIAGTGIERQNLEELCKDLGITNRVTFLGFIPNDDLPNLYRLADVFISPGTAELQSLVTMEAMASGLPVLGVNALALPELIQDKINGLLFNPGDANDLAEKMVAIFSNTDMRKEMGNASLLIIKDHEIDKTISKFEKIYERQINNL